MYVLEIKEILFFGGWLFFSVISFHFELKNVLKFITDLYGASFSICSQNPMQ